MRIRLIWTRLSESSRVAIMHSSLHELMLAAGRNVHGVAGDCYDQACPIAPLNNQYHQYIQGTLLRRESLRCRPRKRAKAIESARVGHRRGVRANRRKEITSVINRPSRVPSPVNCQTGHVGVFPRQAIQTERFATDGERWLSTHPPPCTMHTSNFALS